MINKSTFFEGNLVRDPNFCVTKQGTPCARFTLACNLPKKTDGEQGKANFVPCTAWRELAEAIKEVHKGERIAVVGYYHSNRWKDEKGEWHDTSGIVVDRAYKAIRQQKHYTPSGDFTQFGTAEPETTPEPIPF